MLLPQNDGQTENDEPIIVPRERGGAFFWNSLTVEQMVFLGFVFFSAIAAVGTLALEIAFPTLW